MASDEKDIPVIIGLMVSILTWAGFNFKWVRNLQDKIDKVERDLYVRINTCEDVHVRRDDFKDYRDEVMNWRREQREDMKKIESRLETLMERRLNPRD